MPVLKKISSCRFKFLISVFSLLLCSAQEVTREYQIKAAFIFNFTQFIEWPDHCFSSPQAPAVIGILGTDPLGKYLEELIAGESIGQHPLTIVHYNDIDEMKECHILFINIYDKTKVETVLKKLTGKNVLTIGEVSGFPKHGGMIRLYTQDNKVKIQINVDAAKKENLKMSSKLLKIAEIVKDN